jgi:membrane-bound lytic murein transglycosylase B
MTEETVEDDVFAALVREDEHEQPLRRGRSWLWLPALCVAVGTAVAAGAALLLMMPASPDPVASRSTALTASTPHPTPRATQAASPQATAPNTVEPKISDLPDRRWVSELAEATGIPERALRAYTGASLVLAEEAPTCGLGWNTLAGIGFVESEHGTIHGSHIADDGDAHPNIVGIPLTGETTMSIPDTDGGALDGDDVWDRAVGPMQFIPTTWDEWATDGNTDGVTDPQNIDDAALAAARYLCAAGGALTQPENWIAAIHAYNPTVEYNNRVADAAEHYARSSGSAVGGTS